MNSESEITFLLSNLKLAKVLPQEYIQVDSLPFSDFHAEWKEFMLGLEEMSTSTIDKKPVTPDTELEIDDDLNELRAQFTRFVNSGCEFMVFAMESGDEYVLANAQLLGMNGKYIAMNCEYSKMPDCRPLNILGGRHNEQGEYIVCQLRKCARE